MKVLITGGAGFIGFHTTLKLLDRGDKVVVVDNFNNYYDSTLKEKRAEILLAKGAIIVKADIINYSSMDEIFKEHKPDKVCNLAAQAGVRYSIENPFAYEETNIKGMLNILELCRHNNVSDLVYASSSSVYGNTKEYPFHEEQKLDTPISLYAATKKSNEEMAYTYHHLFGLNCCGLRFFTVYGPYGRPDMALFLFADKILKDESIPVFNHGKMMRDFTYVEDIADGVVSALDNSYPYEIFNLARGECVELNDYIRQLEIHLGKSAKKDMLPMQPGDVSKTSADISKAKRLLNYDPKTSVDEGVGKFVEWYKGYYNV
jgi:UDP-glucuronate 4-epimerase